VLEFSLSQHNHPEHGSATGFLKMPATGILKVTATGIMKVISTEIMKNATRSTRLFQIIRKSQNYPRQPSKHEKSIKSRSYTS